MEKLEIIGRKKLSGTVIISGSKNATLPILAATILANKKIVIKNVPIVRDVETMVSLLNTIGSTVKLNTKKKIIEIHNKKKDPNTKDVDEVSIIKTWTQGELDSSQKNIPDGNYTVGDKIVTIKDKQLKL